MTKIAANAMPILIDARTTPTIKHRTFKIEKHTKENYIGNFIASERGMEFVP